MLCDVRGQDRALLFLRGFVDQSIVSPLLLVGEDGTGRRYAALQAVKEIFCTGDRTSDCKCLDCVQIDEGLHSDLKHLSATESKDLGVDAMREVVVEAFSSPSTAPVRVFLIDGADRMTGAASNALLKTLEEPPATARFLLLAERAQRVIPTIRSRCGKVHFGRLSESVLIAELSKYEHDSTKALVYARMADGSLGRATRYWGAGRLRTRDQVWTLIEHGHKGDLSSLFSAVDGLAQDTSLALRLLEQLLHDLLMILHEPGRIVHVDIADKIRSLSMEASVARAIPRLIAGSRSLRERMRASRINAPFHMKNLFVEAFSGN